ncbi:hypothetical protein LINGRAHAP2_LOCUS6272 [Linum grandiflorum]
MSRFEVKLCSWEHRTRYECVKAQSEKLGLSLSMEGLAYLNREVLVYLVLAILKTWCSTLVLVSG